MTETKMDRETRFIKNTIALMGSQVGIKALSFVLGIFVARYLGATDYGKYSFGYAYLDLFGPVAGLGLNLLIVREASRKREDTPVLVGTSMALKLISSVFVVGLAFLILHFIPSSQDARIIVYIFGLGFILEHLYGSVSMTFAAFERFDIYATVQVIERIVSFAFILTLLFWGFRLIAISWVRPLTALIILLLNLWLASKIILKSRFHFNKNLSPFLLKESWPFMADALFVIVYLKIDIVMLQAMKSSTIVGWYAIASGLLFVFMPLQMAIVQSVFPIFSRTYVEDQRSFALYFERISRFLLSIGTAVAVIATFAASPLMSLLYGKEYIQSASMLRILIWTLPLMSLSSLARAALMSCNLQRIALWVGGSNVIVNIVLNLFFIPVFGGHGAAIATVLTELTGLIIFFIFIKKRLSFVKFINGLRPLKGDDFRAMKELLLKRGKFGKNKSYPRQLE
jgi:O-antigen/teichoic acid export membrane protein